VSTLKVIKLLRHAVTLGNKGLIDQQAVGDYSIELYDPEAVPQAHEAGRLLGPDFILKSLRYRSPYLRTRRTSNLAIEGAGLAEHLKAGKLRFYEDPDLREVEHGYSDVEAQEIRRKIHGWFYYRFQNGESPADCHSRIGIFLESFWRQVKRKKARSAWITSHGLTMRCFVMRWFHLSIEQFESLANPKNCDIITIARRELLTNPQFECGRWGVEGLRFRKSDEDMDARK
jgi:broad specificity phosphatase PhoE